MNDSPRVSQSGICSRPPIFFDLFLLAKEPVPSIKAAEYGTNDEKNKHKGNINRQDRVKEEAK